MSPTFYLFELFWIIALAYCSVHAYRKYGAYRLLPLYLAIPYGVFLEYMTITMFQGYSYGHFLMMLGDIPVGIGIGWAAIVYSVSELANKVKVGEWHKPAVASLLALIVDLVMDPIAVRVGWWNYNAYYSNGFWFGVPAPNFIGWLFVVFYYLLWNLVAARYSGRKLVDPFIALGLSMVSLPLTLLAIMTVVTSAASAMHGDLANYQLAALLLIVLVMAWTVVNGMFNRIPKNT